MKTQQGFIQIPILIAIITSLIAVGAVSYVAVDKYQSSKAEKVKADQAMKDDLEAQKVALAQAQAEIDTLKQQPTTTPEVLPEIKPEVVTPKQVVTIKPKSSTIVKTTPPPVIPVVAPVVVALTSNPSAQCLPIKSEWDNFLTATKAFTTSFSVISFYPVATGGNNPKAALAELAYDYNLLASNKDNFDSHISDVRKKLDTLQKPSSMSSDDFSELKSAYLSSISNWQTAFSSQLQAGKIIADNLDTGVNSTELATSNALYQTSDSQKKQSSADLTSARSIVDRFQKSIQENHTNGCSFGFNPNGDKSIVTMIQAESDFIKTSPIVDVDNNHPPISATFTLKTSLPLKADDGATMTLICDRGATDSYPITRVDSNTISAIVEMIPNNYVNMPTGKIVGRWCKFTYKANGLQLSSYGGFATERPK